MLTDYAEKLTFSAFLALSKAEDEARHYGSPYVDSEHLLLGILQENKTLAARFLGSENAIDLVRANIEASTTIREKQYSVIVLSNESKRVLNHASDEQKKSSRPLIGSYQLLLGLLREKGCFAEAILSDHGVTFEQINGENVRYGTGLLGLLLRDLTLAVLNHDLKVPVERHEELKSIVEVLCNLNLRNPILLGKPGTGKTTLIEEIARRITLGSVPKSLAYKRVLLLAPDTILERLPRGQTFAEQFRDLVTQITAAPEAILCIEDLPGLLISSLDLHAINELRSSFTACKIHCLATSTPELYERALQSHPWLGLCFRSVPIPPLSEAALCRVLHDRKREYEDFHSLFYDDSAITRAAQCAIRFFPGDPLVAKATEMLDAAGSRAKLQNRVLPEDAMMTVRRIRFIVDRMDLAISNKEFEKARFYSDEERKERENLRQVQLTHNLEVSRAFVGGSEIDEVVSRWTGIPVESVSGNRGTPAKETIARHAPDSASAWAGVMHRPGSETSGFGQDRAHAGPIAFGTERALNDPEMLRVFLCHSSQDKPMARELYRRLREQGIAPWLDEENLLGGQDWRLEIGRAVRASHAVIVCLSGFAVREAGYRHREIREVLEVAYEQPEGTIFLIPLRLENCEIPIRLRDWHYVDYFESDGFEKLMNSLRERALKVGIKL
jgi:ATP-dependent Clp protease ATP-binding subunit ClpA